MKFNKLGYDVKRKVIDPQIAKLCVEYLLLKRTAAAHLYNERYLLPETAFYGTWKDGQVPGAWSNYGDILMEILLGRIKPKMEKWTGLKLLETYAYTRLYNKGDILHRHKDRPECEISTTLNLGGDPWPIFIEPNKNMGRFVGGGGYRYYETHNSKGRQVNLKPGDMLLYKGADLEHWRDEFKGDMCAQVFLHYIEDTKDNRKMYLDKRPSKGLPKYFPAKPWLK